MHITPQNIKRANRALCTFDQNPMRIGDLDPKTTLPPHGLDTDPSCVLYCVTVLRGSARDPVQQCNEHSQRAV